MQITSCLSHTQWQAGEFTKGLKIARSDVGARKELSRSRSSRHRFFDDLILASAQRAKPCSRGP